MARPESWISPAGNRSRLRVSASAAAWNREGSLLISGGNTLTLARASAGEPSPATERNVQLFDENHWAPHFLHDGRHYLLLVRGGTELQLTLNIGELGSNERRPLIERVSNAQYAPPLANRPGHLVFVRDRRLMAQPFDVAKLALSGEPVTIAEGVPDGGGIRGEFSVSPAGVMSYQVADASRQELVWLDRNGKEVAAFGNRPGSQRNNVRLSRDGKLAAFTREGDKHQDIWLLDLSRGDASRFTVGGGRSPVWSPEGSRIAFIRQDTVYIKPVAGGTEVPVWSGPGIMAMNDWSGDDRHLLLTIWEPAAGRGMWLMPNPSDPSANHQPSLLELEALHGQFAPAQGAPRFICYEHRRKRHATGLRSHHARRRPWKMAGVHRLRQRRWLQARRTRAVLSDRHIVRVGRNRRRPAVSGKRASHTVSCAAGDSNSDGPIRARLRCECRRSEIPVDFPGSADAALGDQCHPELAILARALTGSW
ncbi:MAG: hypothetical protein ACRD2N_05555 [Vicinamibacterales bacterium]